MTSVEIETQSGQRPLGWRPLHIAMVGQKGLPATFGGIEHHVEQVGRRLAARGHRVTVYCRTSYGDTDGRTYLGMDLRTAPTVGTKHLDAIVHSGTSTVKAMSSRCDIVHYHALGPGLFSPLPRFLSRAGVVLTVHGLDHRRAKWGHAARGVLGAAHWMSGHVPDRTVVVSRELGDHYRETFGRTCSHIPNGVDEPAALAPRRIMDELGLVPGRYVLFVGRLVPEKAPDLLLRSYRDVPGDTPLVIVGDSSFSDGYTAQLRAMAAQDSRVVLTGFAYGDLLSELYHHAGLFVQPSLLEGLPLTLLEAASHGIPILASDIPPHMEVLGREGGPGRRLFDVNGSDSLTSALIDALANLAGERVGAQSVRTQVLQAYRWDVATDQLERLYLELAGSARGARSTGRQGGVRR